MNKTTSKGYQVLAKSKPETSLVQHIDDCLHIWQQLPQCFTRLPLQDVSKFWSVLRNALIFHDTGKSHSEFQRLMYGHSTNAWYHQRHELFSLFYIYQSSLKEEEKRLLYYVVGGHHKTREEILQFAERVYDEDYSGWDSAGVLSFEQECGKLWKNKTWKILGSYGFHQVLLDDVSPVSSGCSTAVSGGDTFSDSYCSFPLQSVLHEVYHHPTLPGETDYLLNLLLVGMMKQCDHLASAGIRQLYRLSDADFSFLFTYPLYAHQKCSYETSGNVILSSPTGSGKTETSLLWLKHQLEVCGEGRVFYVLPYTASINAMYDRLNAQFGMDSHRVGMMHGKLAQYLEMKFSEQGISDFSFGENAQLIQDFKTLVTPLKIVTPFQLLKHLFGVKGFEKGIAEWTGGYFIFDEIHAYDSVTFAQIVVLLEFCVQQLGVRVFVMTATLPSFMRIKLQEALGSVSLIGADISLYNAFDRHRLVLESGLLSESVDIIQNDLDAGLNVLVVCNTVEQAQSVYSSLHANSKLLIHGSFNAEDRSRKEARLRNEDVQLLVGTQAIEVSLDIDYDTIYTEPAPLDALIQRFGRINRKRKKGICVCHVFEESFEKDRFIYEQAVVARTLSVLRENVVEKCEGFIHERELQSLIDKVYPHWEEKQQQKYDITYQSLSQGVRSELSPLSYSAQREEDYYKQFDGVKVLPACLRERYRNYCESKSFIKAEGLLVAIRESRLFALLNEGCIESDFVVYEADRTEGHPQDAKLCQKRVMVILKKYDSELGLQMQVSDNVTDTIM